MKLGDAYIRLKASPFTPTEHVLQKAENGLEILRIGDGSEILDYQDKKDAEIERGVMPALSSRSHGYIPDVNFAVKNSTHAHICAENPPALSYERPK